jgi:hypothetical protein
MAKVELGRRAAGLRWDVRGCFALQPYSYSHIANYSDINN